ncbi:MAG: cytochrome c oxidase subunit II [Candidatus Eremiobacteraeota bacterium]|nr:cytochrome c oxidase subunit II [Candidatus Eremiobacteraeota bacterium]
MVENRAHAAGLGRGFWGVTAVLAVLAALGFAFWYLAPVYEWLKLPVAIETAKSVDELSTFLFATATALYIFILGYIIYFCVAFRARPTDAPDAIGVQVHDNHKLEFWWTLIPTIFVIGLSIESVRIWYQIMPLQPMPNNLVVESIGHQFYWSFRYPQVNGEITGEMHLPVNVPVTLNLTSADVIHSFWVPAMRLKNDMVPGLVTEIRLTPTKIGKYPIVCTQFCGTAHNTMNSMVDPSKQFVIVEDQASFDKWYKGWQTKNAHVSNALTAAPAAGAIDVSKGDANAGKALFSTKCSACHALGPFTQTVVGPGLKGVMSDPSHPNLVNGKPATPADVAGILQTGYTGSMGTMPNQAANGLSDQDIANLVAFLASQK